MVLGENRGSKKGRELRRKVNQGHRNHTAIPTISQGSKLIIAKGVR